VRPAAEYGAGHIAGARSVPIGELRKHLKALPADAQVVAYCRGPYCVLAPEAVTLLRARGYRASALGDGVAEWRAQGLPVASGDAR
jgi:rhodanese-related sulfurtransferase